MNAVIDFSNKILWEYILVYGLLAVGLYFTVRLGFLQFRHAGEMLRTLVAPRNKDRDGISPFQALTVSLAARVGTGNLVGVAVALYLGGPGAIFWMWMVALVGMATAYAESSLAQLYKTHGPDGTYRGGPAFYLARGLGLPWLGTVFSVLLLLSAGLAFNAVQANSIAAAMEGAFGLSTLGTGLGLATLTALVIFGGIRQIARVAEILVPFMAVAYLLLAVVVMALHISAVPDVFWLIVGSAVGLDEAVGGVTGGIMAAALSGIKRGLFSNEAGVGTAPNIAAAAVPVPHHPASQGFVQALGVFIDTLLVCTATAMMILLSGVLEPGSGVTGAQLTQATFEFHLGASGRYFIAGAILLFAFTSILGNYSYSESAMVYLGVGRTSGLNVLRVVMLFMVVWGSVQTVSTVFNMADMAMGLMAVINLVALVALSGTIARYTRDYFEQRRAGTDPVFHAADYPELSERIDHTIWTRDG